MFNKEKNKVRVEKTVKKIKKLFPNAEDINVAIRLDEKGKFITKIGIKMYRKTFHATKIGDNLEEGLQKTFRAMRKQLAKFNNKTKKQYVQFRAFPRTA